MKLKIVETYTLELSKEEITQLAVVVGEIVGWNDETESLDARQFAYDLFYELQESDVTEWTTTESERPVE